MSKPSLHSILYCPVKGFPGLELEKATLETGSGIPNDRRYAFAMGGGQSAERLPPSKLFRCSRHDGLLKFSIRSTPAGFSLTNPDGDEIAIDYNDAQTVSSANHALSDFLKSVEPASQDVPQLIEANAKVRNWDFVDTPVSLINAASVQQITETLGMSNDLKRFRCNLVIEGLEAWEELAWVGKRIRIGEAEIDISRPIKRCPAPGVNPVSGERDIDFAKQLPNAFGHAYCGLYGVVVKGGEIKPSDGFEIVGDAAMSLETATAESEPFAAWTRFVEISDCSRTEDRTLYTLTAGSRWPLAEAKVGQRLRVCMAPNKWTAAYIVAVDADSYTLEVEKSPTSDPVTEELRSAYNTGDKLITCGPFGRV